MPPAPSERLQRRLAAALLYLILTVSILFPAAFVFVDIARGLAADAPSALPRRFDLPLFVRSASASATIAAIATSLALPAAWGARSLPPRAMVFFLIPLLLPSYLAYSGWGLLRAPGTPLGDFLLRGPNWYPVVAGKVLALAGLVLWTWPLSFMLLAARFRRLDPAVLESLRLEPGPRWRKAVTVLAMSRGSILAAAGMVFLITMGSAVPLHVAQFDTYAITIWRALDETPHAQHWRVWARSWPLILLAAAATGLVLRRTSPPINDGPVARARAGGGGLSRGYAVVLWLLSVVVPSLLFATSLRSGRSFATFWRVTAGAIAASVWVSLLVAVLGLVIGAAVWFWRSGARRARGPALTVALVLLLMAGLIPGVLVGSSLTHAYRAFPITNGISNSLIIVAIGHTARFGFLAALIGLLLANSESATLRELRLTEAGGGFRAWLSASALPRVGLLAATALSMGLLSFQEIEATVMLQPPTRAGGSFAQKMLQNLHFARMEELSAGVLLVTGAGLIGCAAILILASPRPAADHR